MPVLLGMSWEMRGTYMMREMVIEKKERERETYAIESMPCLQLLRSNRTARDHVRSILKVSELLLPYDLLDTVLLLSFVPSACKI